MTAVLSTHGLLARYGDFQALYGVDIELHQGEAVALIGANGAGKSTLLRSIMGLLPVAREMVLLHGEAVGGT
ncbi:ATP-binding cassette domain-containing protein, partial [Mesorhizobium sp. M7A.F.Ca.MR.148.00.0.0]